MDEATAYVTLGINEATSPDEARAIYRRRLRLLHPDLHGTHDPQLQLEAERATRQLSTAWQTLQERWSAGVEQPVTAAAAAAPPRGAAGAGHRPPPPRPTAPGPGECWLCGGAPVARGRLRTVRSGDVEQSEERCCRRCGLNAFRAAQSTTLARGWWSPSGPVHTLRAVAGNVRAWWRWRALDDVLPPLRPVITRVVAPAEMVRPVLRRPVPAALAATLVAVVVFGAVAAGLALSGGQSSGPSLGRRAADGSDRPAGTATGPAAPQYPTDARTGDGAARTGSAPGPAVDVAALPGCSADCQRLRSLDVTVAGQRAQLLLVSTAPGRPKHALRFYLVRSSDSDVLWWGPRTPIDGYVSKRLGIYHGSVLRQDATGHVFVDLMTSPQTSFIGVLDLGDGTDVRDFGSLTPQNQHFRFSADTPGADTVDIGGDRVFDIVLPQAALPGRPAYYNFFRWNGADYVARGCARQLVDGGHGPMQPLGSCS